MYRDPELGNYMTALFEQAEKKEIILTFPKDQYSLSFFQTFHKELDNFRLHVLRNRLKAFYFNLANKIDNVELCKKKRTIILRPKGIEAKMELHIRRTNKFKRLLK